MRSGLRLVICLAAFVAAAAAVRAQSFVGIGPVRSFVLPTEPRGEVVPAPAPVPASVVTPPSEARADGDGLRRLPATLRGFRFAGEWAESEWPLYLTAAQARGRARFRLAHLSAISVMPEGSRLTVRVNDTVIGSTRPAPPDAAATAEFEIPAHLLKPGFNALRITAEQRHRVDCSPAATYELWTALDPARTGLVFAGPQGQGFDGASDIAALSPRPDGASAIRIVPGGKLTLEMAGRAIKAAQLAALASGALRPAVSFAAAGEAAYGLDLAIGTAEELRVLPDLADLGGVAGPRYGFLPARPGRAPLFVVTGTNPAELDLALARWEAERRAAVPAGSEAGRRAAQAMPGFAASGLAERIPFRLAGFAGTEFAGRLFRLGLDVAMPMDFLPADYDRMVLNLAGSHAAGLGREARILIEVNGRNAASQMLSSAGARPLDGNQIFLPLSLMQPGPNRIEIVAEVPAKADESCVAGVAPTRLQILDRSELALPRIARIGRSPELSLTAAGGFPFARDGARPILFVPNPDRQTMAAAATLAARLAVAAGRPIDFSFTVTAPAAEAGEVLAVSPVGAFDTATLQAAGLAPARLRQAWQQVSQQAPSGEMQRPAAASFDADIAARRCELPSLPATVLAAGGPVVPNPALVTPALAGLGLRASLPALPFWRGPEPAGAVSEEEALSAKALLAIGQDFPAEQARTLWTVVTAPDASLLKAGVDCLVHPQVWSRLGGRISTLSPDETVLSVAAGERLRHVATADFSLLNLRLVAAGWLSLNPLAYVAIALALVLCLAGSTLWLVLNTGRRQE